MDKPIVIVGAGLAGTRAAEALRVHGFTGRVVLVGAERALPYQRPALSKEVLAGAQVPFATLWLQPEAFYTQHRLELRLGATATALWLKTKTVWLAGGEPLEFDRLIIASGSAPRRLTVPGALLPGVRTLRTWEDALAVRTGLQPGARVVVVGGGLLGAEVAAAARSRGARVTLVERGPALLSRSVGPTVGAALVPFLEAHGVDVRLEATVTAVQGRARADALELAGGEVLAADLVVVALGVEPSVGWLGHSGVELQDGVLVDRFGRSSARDVFAAGDVASAWSDAQGRHVRLESYGFASAHGWAVGRNVLEPLEPVDPRPSGGTVLFGQRLQFAGALRGDERCELVGQPARGRFTAVLSREGEIVGAVALGQPKLFAALRALIGRPAGAQAPTASISVGP